MKNRSHKKRSLFPCRSARIWIHIAFPIILLHAISILIAYLQDMQTDPILANIEYPRMLEYIIASVAILFGYCLLFEILEHDLKNNS